MIGMTYRILPKSDDQKAISGIQRNGKNLLASEQDLMTTRTASLHVLHFTSATSSDTWLYGANVLSSPLTGRLRLMQQISFLYSLLCARVDRSNSAYPYVHLLILVTLVSPFRSTYTNLP
ncbi:BA75_01908T0 [Komagataella pastoris]|uniref:BA75_01908T0 n=1 Tax=Komagataella pastoris TaxID=4922 RepID=A0A1B2JAW1_PICPA|nr:BA75_01908T0 [Komagataella pastoris]